MGARMRKVIFDTNVLLDYFNISCSEQDFKNAKALVTELWRSGSGFLVTPTTLKDLEYIMTACLKRDILNEKGQIASEDAQAIAALCQAALDAVMEVGNVVSLGLADCRMAQTLMKTHGDYEDNLITAAALRMGADCIVSRDGKFQRRCPVACMDPAACLSSLQAGIF